tara:strand:- start:726 stop:2156 length:1431 start_codon:yes stop_codon:yes gene_type:complete
MSRAMLTGLSNEQGSDPTVLYYDATIINSTTSDLVDGVLAAPNPQIRFNETRDVPLIKDVSKYQFSIVRFTMNGPNRDLPLFIPSIQTGQSNVNLTTYAVSISFQQTWQDISGNTNAFVIVPPVSFIQYVPENKNASLAPIPAAPLVKQDITTRYYWLTSYQVFVTQVNAALLQAHQFIYAMFVTDWSHWQTGLPGGLKSAFPFASFAEFQAYGNTPVMQYNDPLFNIMLDSQAFGAPILPFVPIPVVPPATNATQVTAPVMRLFFNTNMQGLFANFPNAYYNSLLINSTLVPTGYTYEILALNQAYKGVIDWRQLPYSDYVPVSQQSLYYNVTQEYRSTDTLWSPVQSIVFTTALLPIRYESTAAPITVGDGNLGGSAPSTQSAFQPTITDITEDMGPTGAEVYRQFTNYIPSGEYRMNDFSPSQTSINNIDIQVYWKCRMDGQLYPMTIYNMGSVNFKMMLRLKSHAAKSQRYD